MPNEFRRVAFTWDALRIAPFGTLYPNTPYWVSAFQLAEVRRIESRAGVRLVVDEGLAPVPFWRGEDLNGQHVAYYHDGALGDELIHAAFQRQFVMRYPGVRLHAIGKHRGAAPPIPGNRYIGEFPFPWGAYIPEVAALAFDAWIAPASVGYEHRGSEANLFDLLTEEIGIDLDLHRPYLRVQDMARAEVRATACNACANFIHSGRPPASWAMPGDFWDRLIVVHLNASEPERTPTRWRDRLEAILAAYGDRYYVAIVGDEAVADAFMAEGAPLRVYAFLRSDTAPSPSLLTLLALTEAARVIICPDSVLLHAAAALDVPTIALWNMNPGAMTEEGLPIPPPASRLATYDNVRAVLDKDGAVAETVAALSSIIA